MLKAGQPAIDFTLPDANGNPVTLSQFSRQKIILYFYPKDMTGGCTKQACAMASAYTAFSQLNAVVIGVSKDSVASHKKFAEKYQLPFLLLSDPDLVAIKAYDVWQEKKLYGKTYMGTMRTTYLIDENFQIIKCYEKASPTKNAQEILEDLQKHV